MTNDYTADPNGPADDGDVAWPSARFLAAMELAQTPEQQSIAREIYKRLEEGADVEDIKPLIEQQMRVVVAQRNGRPVASLDDPPPAGPTGVVGGTGPRPNAWDAGPGSGLGARPEENRRGW